MNTSRNTTLDVARGFTVFIMPGVHSLVYYGSDKTLRSWIGRIMAFLAEGPGAQLFMFLMGTSIALSRKKSAPKILKRSCYLLGQGLLLNVLRLIIPYKLGLIPEKLLQDAGIVPGNNRVRQLLLTGDILQCAAISYLITALLYRRRAFVGYSITLMLAVAIFSPKMWDRNVPYPMLNYVLKLFTGKPPAVFFPIFPWLTYTLAGLAWGHYLTTKQTKYLYRNSLLIGLILVSSGRLIRRYEPEQFKTTFYRLGPGGTFEHLGTVLLWLCLCDAAVKQVKWNRFFALLTRLSKHITKIYFIQWILVLWLLPLFKYRRSGLFRSLLCMIVNTVLTFQVNKLKMIHDGKNL